MENVTNVLHQASGEVTSILRLVQSRDAKCQLGRRGEDLMPLTGAGGS